MPLASKKLCLKGFATARGGDKTPNHYCIDSHYLIKQTDIWELKFDKLRFCINLVFLFKWSEDGSQ